VTYHGNTKPIHLIAEDSNLSGTIRDVDWYMLTELSEALDVFIFKVIHPSVAILNV
jgi:hypothetical protein